MLRDLLLNAGSSDLPAYVNASLSANLGVTDLTVVELNTIVGYITANDFGVGRRRVCVLPTCATANLFASRAATGDTEANHTPQSLSYYLGQQVVSERARLGWTTSGHSAVDVNLYGYLVRRRARWRALAAARSLTHADGRLGMGDGAARSSEQSPGSPPSASLDVLRGNRENTEIGMYIQNYLALNLAEITTILKYVVHAGRSETDAGH